MKNDPMEGISESLFCSVQVVTQTSENNSYYQSLPDLQKFLPVQWPPCQC